MKKKKQLSYRNMPIIEDLSLEGGGLYLVPAVVTKKALGEKLSKEEEKEYKKLKEIFKSNKKR